jgi:hypothetical protein
VLVEESMKHAFKRKTFGKRLIEVSFHSFTSIVAFLITARSRLSASAQPSRHREHQFLPAILTSVSPVPLLLLFSFSMR